MIGVLRRLRERRAEKVCEEARRRIQEVVDGEVPAERERRRLERHVEECAPCGAEASTIREIKDALARVGGEPDANVKERLTELLDEIRSGTVDAEDPE